MIIYRVLEQFRPFPGDGEFEYSLMKGEFTNFREANIFAARLNSKSTDQFFYFSTANYKSYLD